MLQQQVEIRSIKEKYNCIRREQMGYANMKSCEDKGVQIKDISAVTRGDKIAEVVFYRFSVGT